MFVEAFDDVTQPLDVNIVHIGNAIGQFMGFEWRSFDSPFDALLAGNQNALQPAQKRGMDLFFGKGGCNECHSGKLFTDHSFYALALPHYGPGRTRRFDPYVRDVGRMGESDRLEDAYRFRTPSLRNISLTAPYGHNGAYQTLEGIIRHHLDPITSLLTWDRDQAILPKAAWLEDIDFVAFSDNRERKRLASKIDIRPRDLTRKEISDLVAFLHSLTGTESIKGRLGKPTKVPSGLKVD
jgi:cytochrome c peroxidase